MAKGFSRAVSHIHWCRQLQAKIKRLRAGLEILINEDAAVNATTGSASTNKTT